jgi:hypothetical protein
MREFIYLIEMIDVNTTDEGYIEDVQLIQRYYCDTQEEAIKACEELNKLIKPYQTYKVKDEDILYPFYNFIDISKYK